MRGTAATVTRASKKRKFLLSKTTKHVQHAFLYISLPLLHDYDVRMPSLSRFVEDVNKRPRNFLSAFSTWISVLGIQLQRGLLVFDKS